MHDHLPYREGVGVMLVNSENRVFVAKRIDTTSEAWQMPQGGIDQGELPLPAAQRELQEETSVSNVAVIAESRGWHHYDLPADLIPTIWNGRFRGQRQKWFLLRFLGDDSDVNLQTPHPEFCEWQWITPAELPSIIVPFKRNLYAQLVSEFVPRMKS